MFMLDFNLATLLLFLELQANRLQQSIGEAVAVLTPISPAQEMTLIAVMAPVVAGVLLTVACMALRYRSGPGCGELPGDEVIAVMMGVVLSGYCGALVLGVNPVVASVAATVLAFITRFMVRRWWLDVIRLLAHLRLRLKSA